MILPFFDLLKCENIFWCFVNNVSSILWPVQKVASYYLQPEYCVFFSFLGRISENKQEMLVKQDWNFCWALNGQFILCFSANYPLLVGIQSEYLTMALQISNFKTQFFIPVSEKWGFHSREMNLHYCTLLTLNVSYDDWVMPFVQKRTSLDGSGLGHTWCTICLMYVEWVPAHKCGSFLLFQQCQKLIILQSECKGIWYPLTGNIAEEDSLFEWQMDTFLTYCGFYNKPFKTTKQKFSFAMEPSITWAFIKKSAAPESPKA